MTTSADPSRLERFIAEASTSRLALTGREHEVRAAYIQFLSSGSVRGATFAGLNAVPRLIESMEANERFVAAIREALLAADSTHRFGAITVADASIAQQLDRLGVATPAQSILVANSELLGLPPTSGFVDDPVCTANGNFVHVETDLDFVARSVVLDATRTYNSLSAHRSSSFGKGWWSPFDMTLSASDKHADVTLYDGASVRFVEDEDGRYYSPSRPRLSIWHKGDTWVMQDGVDAFWTFDVKGALMARQLGRSCLRYERDGDRIVRCTESVSGRSLEISWDERHIVSIASSDGRTAWYHYEDDDLVDVERPSGGFRYCINNGRIGEIHDADGMLVVGNVYDEHGRVARQHSPFERVSLYTYGESGITVATDTNGAARNAFVHDERGNLTAMIDANGYALRLSYDRLGNLHSWVDRRGGRWTSEWEGGRQIARNGPLGWRERWLWDARGRLLAYEAPVGTTSYTYTSEYRIPTTVTHPGGACTTIDVDDSDRPVAIVDPDGVRTELTWDADGQPTSVTDAFGNTTRLLYDVTGQLQEVQTPSSLVVAYEADRARRVTSVQTPGARWEQSWSTAGRATAGRDPIEGEWRAAYGSHGAVERIIDVNGATTTFEYDVFGNISKTIGPDGRIYQQEHDGLGRLTSTTDPAGNRWDYRFDPEGALVEIASPDGSIRRRVVDALGRTTQEINEDGQVSSFVWSNEGRLVRMESPAGNCDYEYDSAGQLIAIRESGGHAIHLEHSPGGRLIRRADTSGRDETYEYDQAGRLGAIVNSGTRVELARDVDGRVVRLEDARGRTLDVSRDPAGQWTAMSGDDGRSLRLPGRQIAASFEWNDIGLLTAASDAAGATTRYEYDIAGRVRRAIDPLGGSTSYDYDTAGRIEKITDPSGVSRPLATGFEQTTGFLSPSALPTTASRAEHTDGGTARRDENKQLLEWRARDVHFRYAYDVGGRLIEESGHNQTTRYEHDAGGRLLRRSQSNGETTCYRYDDQGRRTDVEFTNGSSIHYAWDDSSRLSRVIHVDSQGNETCTDWRYDELGLLVRVGDIAIDWALHDGWPVVTRIGDATYAYVGGDIVVRSGDGSTRRLDRDQMGNCEPVRDPWGTSSETGVRLGYRGALCIDELIWLHARVYDPETRSFLSPDPLPNPPGMPCASNPYHYAWNDPVANVDPTGLRPLTHEEFQRRTDNESVGVFERTWRAMSDHPWDGLHFGLTMSARTGLTFVTSPGAGLLVTSGSAASNAVLNRVTDALSDVGERVTSVGGTMWNAGGAALDIVSDVNGKVGDVVWGVTRGVARGVGDIAQGAWDTVMLSWHVSPARWMFDRDGWQRDVDQFASGISYAIDHPLETLQQVGKATLAWDTFAKGHYAEGVGESLVGIGSFIIGGKGLTKLLNGPPHPRPFTPDVDTGTTKKLFDELGVDRANEIITELGPDAVRDMLSTLTPRDLTYFVDRLGSARVKEVQETYGVDAMAHYGAEFFAEYQGITDDTMKHVIYGDGVTRDGISGAHDRDEFFRQLQGRGEVINIEDDPTRPGISQIAYQLYVKDMTGAITDPPKLSPREIPPKTVITDFAANAEQWRNEVTAAIDNAIRTKTLDMEGRRQTLLTETKGSFTVYFGDRGVETFFPAKEN